MIDNLINTFFNIFSTVTTLFGVFLIIVIFTVFFPVVIRYYYSHYERGEDVIYDPYKRKYYYIDNGYTLMYHKNYISFFHQLIVEIKIIIYDSTSRVYKKLNEQMKNRTYTRIELKH